MLDFLNHRQVCWVAAVYAGVKPSAIIESIDVFHWKEFSSLLEKWGLIYCYKGSGGWVLWNGLKYFYLSKEFKTLETCAVKPAPKLNYSIEVADVVISREKDIALELLRLWLRKEKSLDDHCSLGELLGYPKCCVEKFLERGFVMARHVFHEELIKEKLNARVPIEFWAVYHTPCSVHCSETLRLGREYINSVNRVSEQDYRHVLSKLHSSYIAYSVGSRYFSFKRMPLSELDHSVAKRYENFVKHVGRNCEVTVGLFNRPFVYAFYESGSNVLKVGRDFQGLKFLAYSPGEFILIFDPFTGKTIVKLDSSLFKKYGDLQTVFRVYSSEERLAEY